MMNGYLKVALMTVCLLACLVGCWYDDSVSTEQTLQKKFPVGTPAEDVERVLKQENIEHSFVAKENAFYAIVRDTGKSGILVKESVTMVIYLDDDKKQVKGVKTRKYFTGP